MAARDFHKFSCRVSHNPRLLLTCFSSRDLDPLRYLRYFPSILLPITSLQFHKPGPYDHCLQAILLALTDIFSRCPQSPSAPTLEQELRVLWPLLIRGHDASRFTQELTSLSRHLNLDASDVCLIMQAHSAHPEQYPASVLRQSLEFFDTRSSQVSCQALIGLQIGQLCMPAFYDIITGPSFEKPRHGQVQLTHFTVHHSIKHVLHQTDKAVALLEARAPDEMVIAGLLDRYLRVCGQGPNQVIFQVLQTLCVLEGLQELEGRGQGWQGSKRLIERLKDEALGRWMNLMFARDEKLRTVIFEWMLQGRAWSRRPEEELGTKFVTNLTTLYELDPDGQSNQVEGVAHSRYQWYLRQIEHKFCDASMLCKVPRYYQEAQLRIFTRTAAKQSLSSLASQTRSMEKLGQEKQPEGYKISEISRSIFHLTETLQLPQVYVYLSILIRELTPSGTSSWDSKESEPQAKSLLMKIFYRIRKALTEYCLIFDANRLTSELERMLAQLPTHFRLGKCVEICKHSYPELGLSDLGGLKLDEIAATLLQSKRVHSSLVTILKVDQAQTKYNCALYNSSGEQKKDTAKEELGAVPESRVNTLCHRFQQAVCQLIQLAVSRKAQVELLREVVAIGDPFTTNTVYLNVLYLLLSPERGKKVPTKEKKAVLATIEKILKDIICYYLLPNKALPNNQTQEGGKAVQGVQAVQKIILTAHMEMQHWKQQRRGSENPRSRGKQSAGSDNLTIISQYLWETLVSSVKACQLGSLARQYERINLVKESIYLLQCYDRRQFPAQPSAEEVQHLYHLHSRLDGHLQKCSSYVAAKLQLASWEKPGPKTGIDSEWRHSISLLVKCTRAGRDPDSGNNACMLAQMIARATESTASLQESPEINRQLCHSSLLGHLHCFMRSGRGLPELTQYLAQLNRWEYSQPIIFLLKARSAQLGAEACAEVTRLFWDEHIRFERLGEMAQYLRAKQPQDMNFEELRASIKLSSLQKNHEYVRLLYKTLLESHALTLGQESELHILNIEATYKSVLVYPARKMVDNLKGIVDGLLQAIGSGHHLELDSTRHFYEAFRFLCESYNVLEESEQRQMTVTLVSYLDLALSTEESHRGQSKLVIEAMYFLLRFLISECWNLSERTLREVPLERYSGGLIEPHKNFLISSIEEGKDTRNSLIHKLLLKTAEYNPVGSCWWLYSMVYHDRVKAREKLSKTDLLIINMGQEIQATLSKKKISLDQYLQWIKWLHGAQDQDELMPIPDRLASPFGRDTTLSSVSAISALGTGKSNPVLITLVVVAEGAKTMRRCIRKQIEEGFSGWKTESSTANFFKECGVVDPEVTYEIVHLSKHTILIEYIPHLGTLNDVLLKDLGLSDKNQLFRLQRTLRDQKAKKLLSCYEDTEKSPVRYRLDEFLHSDASDMEEWWSRYTSFVRTLAQWSFIGYVVGLGDRHTNNVLLRADGRVIHIDFEYIFDAGKILPYPEWVPFRLTRALEQAMSAIEPFGLFYSELVKAALQYRRNQRHFWRALSNFAFFKTKKVTNSLCERAQMSGGAYEEGVRLIEKAIDSLLLRDMYIGWGSYK